MTVDAAPELRTGGEAAVRNSAQMAVWRTVEVETPEQVSLAFELAGLGSRFVALVADGVILFLLVMGLGSLLVWVAHYVPLPPVAGNVALALLGLMLFLVGWGYFVYFEGFHHGRTPGKRWQGIRVVHDGGYPLTLRGAAVRNLVRFVDLQPAATCLVGGVAMFLDEQTKRLGDMAAGTLVVRDRADTPLPEADLSALTAMAPPRLQDAQFDALDRYVLRRTNLPVEARDRLAASMVRALGEKGLAPNTAELTDDERLRRLHEAESRRRAWGAAGERTSALAAALFRQRHEEWREYEELVERARAHGLASLPEEAVSRFAALYRLVAADLARVRSYRGSGALTYSLERLVAEGHNLFYRPETRSWAALWDWLSAGFPRLVRARWGVVAVAATALFAPAVVTYATVRADPAVAREILPAAIVARAESAPARLREGRGYVDVPGVTMPLASSGIAVNNVRLSFLVFAGGALAGLGALALLVFNGIYLGAVIGLYDAYGAGALIWTFVAPHGILELSAICIAGGAGLWLGSGLLFPGSSTRRAAFVARGREAVSLLAGTTMLLLLAASVEGFASPSDTPAALRLSLAAGLALSFLAYILLAGRTPRGGAGAPEGEEAPPQSSERYLTSR